MPLKLLNKKLDKLRGEFTIKSLFPLHDANKQVWKGESDNYIIRIRYYSNIVLISMSEIEYDVGDNEQAIAIQQDLLNKETIPITLKEILEFLDWECEDYLD
jgi:hypothetical protein|tara:strand:- start:176 stop:481 length:306 start_codon:yes stop_codon:yes gene_type:complete